MRDGPAKKQAGNIGIAHYAWLFALWVVLVGIGFAANYFARNDVADFGYVLFTATVAVALLDQLWKLKS